MRLVLEKKDLLSERGWGFYKMPRVSVTFHFELLK